jgi:GntR family transcriptional regulator
MLEIDPRSAVPLYDQIKAGLRGLVAKGLLKPGDQTPSIRSLAVSLKVNPNTVARAFRELASEGFLESRRGDGAYVSEQAQRQVKDGLGEARAGFKESVRLARRSGLGWTDLESLIKEEKAEER